MARVISICNQKGGVGKTTTSVNLGAYIATLGKRILLIDFDPQANASSALGYNPLEIEKSIYHGILQEVEPYEIVKPSVIYNFHLVPSAPNLAGSLIEFVNLDNREYFLRRFINYLRYKYDYILIDLPPSLSLLTVNGLVASDEVIIPVQAEYYSLEGLSQLLDTIELIRKNLRHNIKISGALLTMYDKREKLSREINNNLRKSFPYRVFDTVIPRSVALAEAPSFSRPVVLYRPDSAGAEAYEKLAAEIVNDENKTLKAEDSREFGNFNI